MMWRTHAASGLAAGAVLLAVVPVDGLADQLGFVAACGGAALLPDWDHPSSSVAVMWGPISRTVHRVVAVVFRGHRGGTHDWLLAPLVFAALAYAATLHPAATAAATAVAVGATLRALAFVIPGHKEKSWPVNLAVSVAAGWWIALAAGYPWWLPVAYAVGVLAHIAGDAVTRSSVPRPFSWLDGRQPGDDYAGTPFTTGAWYETWLVFPALVICAVVALSVNSPDVRAYITPVLTAVGAALS
jgi:hypothetical protein